jgi:hypothetical protein
MVGIPSIKTGCGGLGVLGRGMVTAPGKGYGLMVVAPGKGGRTGKVG